MKTEKIDVEDITISKDCSKWNKRFPYIVRKGDIRASFNSKEKAEAFAKKEMPYKYITTDATGIIKDTRHD